MKRRLTVFAWLLLCGGVAHAGSLQELYRANGLRLSPDSSYAAATDWRKAFSDYSEEAYGNRVGTYKQLAVAPDGSVFVSNYGQYTIHKFDPSGKLVMTFGTKGNLRGQFRGRPELGRILDGRYLPVRQRDGQIDLFDLDGRFVRAVKVNYPISRCVGLAENRLALGGLILQGGKRPPKDRIAILDVDTGKEVEVRSSILSEQGQLHVRMADGHGTFSLSSPFAKVETFLAATSKGNLVSGFSNSPEITVHSPEGRPLGRFELQIEPIAVTDKVKQEYFDAVARHLPETGGLPKVALEALREPWFFPSHLPYYYNLIVDSEDNILVFPYTDDTPSRRFQVYTLEGKLVAESSLDPGDFELNLNPRFRILEFAGLNLYGILPRKNVEGVPLRLFRVDLAAQPKR